MFRIKEKIAIILILALVISLGMGVFEKKAQAAVVIDDALIIAAAALLVIGGVCFLTSDAADVAANKLIEWLPDSVMEILRNMASIGQIFWDPVLFRYLWDYKFDMQQQMNMDGYFGDKNYSVVESGSVELENRFWPGTHGKTIIRKNNATYLSGSVYKLWFRIDPDCAFQFDSYEYASYPYKYDYSVKDGLFTSNGMYPLDSVFVEIVIDAVNWRMFIRYNNDPERTAKITNYRSSDKEVWVSARKYVNDFRECPYVFSEYVGSLDDLPTDAYIDELFQEGDFVDIDEVIMQDVDVDENILVNISDIAGSIEDIVGKTAEDIEGITVTTTGIYGVLQNIWAWIKALVASVAGILELITTGLVGDITNIQLPDISVDMINTRFPFSLPWDLKNAIGSIAYSEELPEFNLKLPDGFGSSIDMVISIPNEFRFVITFIRAALLLVFMVGLVLGTGKLLGGAK